MATTYNCEIRNFFGSTARTAVGLSVSLWSDSAIRAYVSFGGSAGGPTLFTSQDMRTFISGLGYDNISNINLEFNIGDFFGSGADVYNSSWNQVVLELEDGTTTFFNGTHTGESPVVDYYMDEIHGLRLTFNATRGSSTVATGFTHDISITADTFPKLRTFTDIKNFLTSIGLPGGNTALPNNQPAIHCEAVNDEGDTTTSSSVNISSDFSTTTVTNTVIDNTGVSQADFDALKADLQTQIDNQVIFVNTVSEALNRNVSGALQSSTETRDLLVALQLGTIPNIESRLTALENE